VNVSTVSIGSAADGNANFRYMDARIGFGQITRGGGILWEKAGDGGDTRSADYQNIYTPCVRRSRSYSLRAVLPC
jgi:hypothetical protein